MFLVPIIISTCPSEIVAPWPRRRKPSSPLPTHCLVGAFQTEVIQAKWKWESTKQDFIWCAHCFEIDQIWISSCELFEKSCFIHSLVREKDVFWKLYRKVFKVKREKNHLCRIPPIDFYIIRSCHDYMCIVESARGLKSNLTALFPAIL